MQPGVVAGVAADAERSDDAGPASGCGGGSGAACAGGGGEPVGAGGWGGFGGGAVFGKSDGWGDWQCAGIWEADRDDWDEHDGWGEPGFGGGLGGVSEPCGRG